MTLTDRLTTRLLIFAVVAAVGIGLVAIREPNGAPTDTTREKTTRPAYRPFESSSYWNTPADELGPYPKSERILEFLQETNEADGCVQLVGGDDSWGMPIYWVDSGDPTYNVTSTRYPVPEVFSDLRIPGGAHPSDNSDAEMVLFDLERGYVASLSKAAHDPVSDTWTVGGGSVAYVSSNGLDRRVTDADDQRNFGSHRGLNGAVMAVRRDEIEAGRIDRVLKVAVADSARDRWIAPMTGTDGDSQDPSAPPQGVRIRIARNIDLDRFDLHPEARIIAEALQRYGAVIGDSSGGGIALKLESRRGEDGGWELDRHALCAIPLDVFEVVGSR